MYANDQKRPMPNNRDSKLSRNSNLATAMRVFYKLEDVTCCKLMTKDDGSTYWRILFRDDTTEDVDN